MTAAEGPAEHVRNALAIILAHGSDPASMDVADLQAVVARLRRAVELLEHVNIPFRRNPALAILGANPRVEGATQATWAQLEYMRPDDPDDTDGRGVVRVHEFPDGFEIAWLSDGSVQLQHPDHKPLWIEDGT